jgi:hypothetical protein
MHYIAIYLFLRQWPEHPTGSNPLLQRLIVLHPLGQSRLSHQQQRDQKGALLHEKAELNQALEIV